MVDWNKIRARVEVAADSLDIPDTEVEAACANDDGLLAFAARHNQSLDWLVLGDLRPMLRMRARR